MDTIPLDGSMCVHKWHCTQVCVYVTTAPFACSVLYVYTMYVYACTCIVYMLFTHVARLHMPAHAYRVNHPNIVKLRELYDDKAKLYLVMAL